MIPRQKGLIFSVTSTHSRPIIARRARGHTHTEDRARHTYGFTADVHVVCGFIASRDNARVRTAAIRASRLSTDKSALEILRASSRDLEGDVDIAMPQSNRLSCRMKNQ